VYDNAGRTIGRIDPLSRRSSTSFDAAGRSIAAFNPAPALAAAN
jgi:YD repeat-containing protein